MRKKERKKHKRTVLRLLTYYVKCVMRLWTELYSKALYDVFVMKCLTARSTFRNAHFRCTLLCKQNYLHAKDVTALV